MCKGSWKRGTMYQEEEEKRGGGVLGANNLRNKENNYNFERGT